MLKHSKMCCWDDLTEPSQDLIIGSLYFIGGIMSLVSFIEFITSGIPTIIQNNTEDVIGIYNAWLGLIFTVIGLIIIGITWLCNRRRK